MFYSAGMEAYALKPYEFPDAAGHFGPYGGVYVAETLMQALAQLQEAYDKYHQDPEFLAQYHYELKHFVGRPTPVYYAKRWSEQLGGAQIWFKREDLNHTGAHKINNSLGQALLAHRMGKKRIIAETGAGQHGVATATVCARFGMECVVYMGSEDVKRQAPNVYRMKLLGATVVPVEAGSKTLKDALNEALRDWVTNVDAQRQPDYLVASVGGGSNAMGLFYPYINDEAVKLIGVEAAGLGLASGKHAAPLNAGFPGVLHGNRTYVVQNEEGQILPTHSISAGLDYPGVGPEHAWLHDTGRATYEPVTDDEALEAFHTCCRIEGIIPALESSHALAYASRLAKTLPQDKIILVNLSGRGDKDINTIAKRSGIDII